MEIKVPLRLDIAGSFTDLPGYRTLGGGHITLPLDYHLRVSYNSSGTEDSLASRFSKSVSNALKFNYLPLSCGSDLDLHGGLGSSSALVVGIIRFYAQFYGHRMDDEKVAEFAVKLIETENAVCGRQDEYSAAFGVPLYLRYSTEDQVFLKRIKVPEGFIEKFETWSLIYTPRTVTAQAVLEYEASRLFDSRAINNFTTTMAYAIANDDWKSFWVNYWRHWNLIMTLKKFKGEFATLAKLLPGSFLRFCGAGGGGFVVAHEEVDVEKLVAEGYKVFPVKITLKNNRGANFDFNEQSIQRHHRQPSRHLHRGVR